MIRKMFRFRILFIEVLLFAYFAVIVGFLYHIQVVSHEDLSKRAEGRQFRTIRLSPHRGDILDRNGKPLATSTFLNTAYLDTSKIKHNKASLARRLAIILQIPEEKVLRLLQRSGTVTLARKISEEKVGHLISLRQDYDLSRNTIFFRKESKRLYPKGALAGPVLGYTTIDDGGDNVGLDGLEFLYNDEIRGRYAKQVVETNVWRQSLEPLEDDQLLACFGNTLVLTLDASLQHYAESALNRAVAEWEAEAGVVVVQAIRTGEILAMANCPSFDPNAWRRFPDFVRRNRCITDPIEPGSVMKVFTVAALTETNQLSPYELIDCEGGRARIEGRRVTDVDHHLNVVPFSEAFLHSSNVALTKVGLRLEPRVFYEKLYDFGFGRSTGVDLPGEGRGILYPVKKWTDLSRTSLPVGYEIAMTATQIVSAVSAIANNGRYMQPYIVKEIRTPRGKVIEERRPKILRRVVGPHTSEILRDLMEGVVREGTGRRAAVPGYRVAGKTGTTKIRSDDGKYDYIGSFAGFLPVQDPQLAIYVYIYKPKREHYGGVVAAPVFREVAENATRLLGIPPEREIEDDAVHVALGKPATVKTFRRTSLGGGESTPSGRMPDLRGLTMREVEEKLREFNLDVRFLGSGIVVKQDPEPATEIASSQRCLVIFNSPSEVVNISED